MTDTSYFGIKIAHSFSFYEFIWSELMYVPMQDGNYGIKLNN